ANAMSASSRLSRRLRMVCLSWCGVVEAYTPPCGPGIKPLFAEQYSRLPANTHGLAVGLGGMFLGRTALRCRKSRTATPVYSIWAPPGRLETSIVALAGVLPNSKRRA